MKKLILLLAFIAISSVSFTSCEKEDVAPTPAELLSAEIWTGVTASFEAPGVPSMEEDISNFTLEFLTDGTAKLYKDSELLGAGNWELSANGSTLEIDIEEEIDIEFLNFSLNDMHIATLTESELVFSGSKTLEYNGLSAAFSYTVSFKHE